MHYPAAQKGVAAIFKAEIIQIIAAVAIGVSIIIASLGVAGAIIGVIIMAVAFVAEIVALITNLVGLHKAGDDEKSFKTGLIFAIIGIIVAIVGYILVIILGGITQEIVDLVCTAFEIIIALYVCDGISKLLSQIKGQQALALKAKKLMVVIIVLFIISVILGLIGGLMVSAVPALTIILAICYIIAKVAAYVTYLVLLAQAKVAL